LAFCRHVLGLLEVLRGHVTCYKTLGTYMLPGMLCVLGYSQHGRLWVQNRANVMSFISPCHNP
jgi:hypothetical protein